MLKLYEMFMVYTDHNYVMDVRSGVLTFEEDKHIEKVDLWILKYILNVPVLTPTMAVRGELRQLPLHLRWKEKLLKYKRICLYTTGQVLHQNAMAVSLSSGINQCNERSVPTEVE